MTRTVLVCGATGFIGRNVAEALAARGDRVIAVHHRRPPFGHPGISWVQADLTRAEDVGRVVEGVDAIVQAAAVTSGARDIIERPHIHVTDNAVMNSLLFRAAHERGVGHFILFSCSIMYASAEEPRKESDFDANAEMHPNYFAGGWNKVYFEKMAEFFSRCGKTRFTAIRHSNIYGPHDKFDLERSHVFGATLTKVMTARDGRIVVWGPGEEARDVLYVGDLVDFVLAALDRQTTAFELVNVGSGVAVPVKELVARIVAVSGRPLAIEHDLSRPSIRTSVCLDRARARDLFGWEPRVPLDEGIARTIAWWRDHVGDPS